MSGFLIRVALLLVGVIAFLAALPVVIGGGDMVIGRGMATALEDVRKVVLYEAVVAIATGLLVAGVWLIGRAEEL